MQFFYKVRTQLILLMIGAAISLPTMAQQEISLPGLSAPVTVSFDELGIPTISGVTELDVAFMQGYLHAQDRFFAMDLNRRVASGTSAELFGPTVLPDDIQLRTLGLRRAAWATYTEMTSSTRAWLQAYANGVNVFLSDNALPPEYQALELDSVPPWSPVDSIVVGKALAFQLSFDLDIDNTILALAYQMAGEVGGFDGAALFSQDLVRSAPTDDRVSVEGFLASIGGLMLPSSKASGNTGEAPQINGFSFDNIGSIDPVTAELAEDYRNNIVNTPLLGDSLNRNEMLTGSNAWVVSGAVTASGDPILANDPHLSLSFPSTFTEEQLIVTDTGLTVSGVSVPGAPGIIQGCNNFLCWGTTTNPMDVTDVYQETLVTNGLGLPIATVFQGQQEPILAVFQSYFVNTAGNGELNSVSRANIGFAEGGISFIVPRRNNGPLVQVDGTSGLSVQYTGWGPTFELEAFRQINQASSLDAFTDALQLFDVGSQNFLYADIEGNIGYFTSAENPIRADLQNDMAPSGGIPPFLIRDGSGVLNHEWLPVSNPQPGQAVPFEVLPFNEMPQSVNPDSNYLANANNDPIGTTLDNNPLNQVRPGGGLYYLNPGYSDFRQGRIDRVLQDLTAAGGITEQDMINLQANNQLLDAELLLQKTAPVLQALLLQAIETGRVFDIDCLAFEPTVVDLTSLADVGGNTVVEILCDERISDAINLLSDWDFSTPTGIQEGFDPGDVLTINTLAGQSSITPATVPTGAEINASVAATVFATWRSQLIANSIDETLTTVGLGDFQPGNRLSLMAVNNIIESFPTQGGIGASGLPLLPEILAISSDLAAMSPEDAAALVEGLFGRFLIQSLSDALDLLASDEFAPAFNNSEDIMDYRWGLVHRIVFNHPLNVDPFNVPNGGGFTNLSAGLSGVARAGGFDSVDAATHSTRADGLNEFMFGSGPARRFVGTLTDSGPVGQEVIPGGRSSVFFSPNYTDQLPLWLVNDFHALTLGTEAATATAVNTISFTPSSSE